MHTIAPPDQTEFAQYYVTYVSQVPQGDIRGILEAQESDTLQLLRGIPEDRSLHRYAPDKWTIREVVSHINDTERMFVFRAMWFARGFDSALPSFDQDVAIRGAGADARTFASHLEEFRAVRDATVALFRHLPDEAWSRRGVASGNAVTVRALAYITAGHVAHHVRLLRERYL